MYTIITFKVKITGYIFVFGVYLEVIMTIREHIKKIALDLFPKQPDGTDTELSKYEKLLMTEYIHPLFNHEPFIAARPLSDIGSVEKIDSYYEKYISLLKKLSPSKVKSLSKIVYSNNETKTNYSEEELKKFNKEFGNAFNILSNYHCLATYLPDDKAEKWNALTTENNKAHESKNYELIMQQFKKLRQDEEFENDPGKMIEIYNRKKKMNEWLNL